MMIPRKEAIGRAIESICYAIVALLRPTTRNLAFLATTIGVSVASTGKAKADLVFFWDSTDPVHTVAEGVPNTLGQTSFASSTFGTIGAGSAHFNQQRVVTELSFIGALAGGSWNDFSFRIGDVNNPLAYLTQNHSASTVGSYSFVSNEVLRLTPNSINFHATVGGVDTFRLTFSNLNFELAPFQEFTPIIAPFYDNGGIGGPGSFHLLANTSVFGTDDYIHHRLVTNGVVHISDWQAITNQGVNSSLAFSVAGHVSAVPEPSSLALLAIFGISASGYAFRSRRRIPAIEELRSSERPEQP